MPTDDIFDAAWGVAADDEIKKFGFIEGLARDFGFTDYANRMREQQEARDKLNAAVRQQMIIDPNAMTNIRAEQARMQQAAQEQTRMDELEARLAELRAELTNRDTVEGTVDDTMGTPPDVAPPPETPVSDATATADAVVAQPPPPELDVEPDPSLSVTEPKAPKEKRRPEVGQSFEEPEAEEREEEVQVMDMEGIENDTVLNLFDTILKPELSPTDRAGTYQALEKLTREGNDEARKMMRNLLVPSVIEFLAKEFNLTEDQFKEGVKASLDHDVVKSNDAWTVVSDPFANPFHNQNAFDLTDQKPPEVTYDDSPVFEVDTSLIKGPSPEDALNDAGFNTRQGDDVSLLPSSVFRQGESAPVDNTSLLPKGWKTSE